MKIKSGLLKFAATTGMVLSMATVPALAAQTGDVHDHGQGVTELRLNEGAKWAIDAPLSQAMNNIRNVMYEDLDAIHSNKLEGERYVPLSKKVNEEVAYMVENCELEPEADAQLHLIIHDLLEGSTAMESQTNSRDGALRVIGALENYVTYFDDPDFTPLPH